MLTLDEAGQFSAGRPKVAGKFFVLSQVSAIWFTGILIVPHIITAKT